MGVKEMHPLCCISLESPGIGNRSPEDSTAKARLSAGMAQLLGGSEIRTVGDATRETGSDVSVAGVLHKWTNYGKGWRSRWFLLRNGFLSYSKIGGLEDDIPAIEDVHVIGSSSRRFSGLDRAISSKSRKKPHKTVRTVHLKVSSFRESKSDDRRFYIFTTTKTLHLRTDSGKDRVAWIEALVSGHSLFPLRQLSAKVGLTQSNADTAKRLRDRLLKEGLDEVLIADCERIVLLELSDLQGQLKLLYEERCCLIDMLRKLEAPNIESVASGIHDGNFQILRHEISSPGQGIYSECSTTESSDDVGKQELEEVSDEDEPSFFDANEYFSNPTVTGGSLVAVANGMNQSVDTENYSSNVMRMHVGSDLVDNKFPHIERRRKLPDPIEKEKGVSLWSMIKDNVGKDLTRVCLPVYFNEPISSLQKCFEDMEYSYLLDRAYEFGKMGNSLLRILNVAAFAVSGYASCEGRHRKPFNPLLGETYEADYPEKGIRFFSEKVSHHPMLIACHCEGKGWKFWGDSNIRSKFWGRSIQLDPVGVLTLEFDDGEIFQWSKVTTTIYNLILGKVYCDHHGTMHIKGNRQYSCKLKFKEQSILDRNPHQVQGFVEDVMGNKVATLLGKWDDSMHYVTGDGTDKLKGPLPDTSLLWKRSKPPTNITRYNLPSFAITLNELTPGLQEKLPPTDSRLRPDQRHLENGEYEKANVEKLRLETRQRMSRKLQESGWKPRWFCKDGSDGSYHYVGGYWEARQQKNWTGCPNIFKDFSEGRVANPSDKLDL